MMYIARNTFSAARDVPELTGKVILVTGGNTGLGKQYILDICRHRPAQVWLASRSIKKARAAIDEIRKEVPDAPIEILQLDLASLSSVKKAAKVINDRCSRLDILMLNAGIMFVPAGTTEDGYEIQFGTNYLGHALLTILLLPLLEQTATAQGDTADVRIVGLTSWGHNYPATNGIEFESLRSDASHMWNMSRYGQSKLATILMMRHLAKLHPNICTSSVHPGMVATELGRPRTGPKAPIHSETLRTVANWWLSRVEDGVKNQLWASVAQDVKSGEYYEPVGIPSRVSALGKNDELAKKLWNWTEEALGNYTKP
jgi:NAD(P)-dependent dehydrogenase (short-subunit alcohol dehydrogenase family)